MRSLHKLAAATVLYALIVCLRGQAQDDYEDSVFAEYADAEYDDKDTDPQTMKSIMELQLNITGTPAACNKTILLVI